MCGGRRDCSVGGWGNGVIAGFSMCGEKRDCRRGERRDSFVEVPTARLEFLLATVVLVLLLVTVVVVELLLFVVVAVASVVAVNRYRRFPSPRHLLTVLFPPLLPALPQEHAFPSRRTDYFKHGADHDLNHLDHLDPADPPL